MSRFDGNIIIGTSVDVGGIGTGLQKITNGFNKLSRAIQSNMLTSVFSNAASAASDLIEVQNIVDVTFEDMAWKAERFGSIAVEKFGMSELTAKQTAGSFMAMGKAMDLGAENASNMAIALAGLTGDFASFYNISQEYARVALSAVYTGETETLKRYGIILTEANLQQFANSKGIEENVKLMDAREKAILRYQYVMEQASFIQGDFERTQGSFANQTRLLGQVWNEFLVVLGQGVTTVLTPMIQVLNVLIVKLKEFTGVVLAIMSNIFHIDFLKQAQNLSGIGHSIVDNIEEAAEAEDDLADATGRATKAAWKALQPFDELNVIRTPASGGSGKGGGADIFGDWEAEIPFELPDKLKEIFDSSIDNLYDFGRWLSQGLIDILDKIDWDLIYDKARKIGTGFAEFLNGLFNPEMFYKVAKTIANGFNTIIYNIQAFAEEFNWEQFGEAIGEGINGFVENFDWETAGDTLQKIVDGLEKMLKKIAETVNWADLISNIFTLLSKIPWEIYLIAIGTILLKALTKLIKTIIIPAVFVLLKQGASTIISNVFKSIAKTIGEVGLRGFFKIVFKGILKLIPKFAKIGVTIAAAIAAAIAGYFVGKDVLGPILSPDDKGFYENFSWFGDEGFFDTIIHNISSVSDAVTTMFTDLDSVSTYLSPVSSFFESIRKFFEGFKESDAEKVGESIHTALLSIVNTFLGPIAGAIEFKLSEWIPDDFEDSFNSIFTVIGEKIIEVKELFADFSFENVKTAFNEDIVEPIKTGVDSIKEFVRNSIDNIKNFVSGAYQFINFGKDVLVAAIKLEIDRVKTFISELKTNIETWVEETKTKILEKLEIIKTWLDTKPREIVNNLKSKVYELQENIKSTVTSIWNFVNSQFIQKAQSWLYSAYNNIKSKLINPLIKGVEALVQNAKIKFSELWDSAKEGARGFANNIISFIETMINSIINAFNGGLLSWFNKVVSAASKFTKESWTPIDNVSNISIPRLATGAVIPPNAPFLAMLGDQKSGTNIEAPLDTIKQALAEVLGSGNGGEGEIHIHIDVDGREIAKTMVKQNDIYRRRTGRSLLV